MMRVFHQCYLSAPYQYQVKERPLQARYGFSRDSCLVLEDDAGNNKPIAPQALPALFKLHREYLTV
ncbi:MULTISPECIES: hypothetical protein [Nostocales]|uniref:Uncharacterized protein n=1 Tax=Tolypothrix bouteillei VB521301 TaxID=1479485 RepID=A0A0C1RKS0_9CYAN